MDPHGDLVDEVLARMPDHRHQDLILVDPADPKHSVAFNVLHASSDLERQLLSSDLVATFRRLSTSWGDRMNSVLANAVLAFLESSDGGTLLDMRRFLVDRDFRARFLTTITDTEVRYFWEREYPQLSRQAAAPVLTRLDTFLRPKLVRHMVAQKTSSFDLRDVMDSSKVLLIRLSQGAIGQENAALLGAFFVSRLHQAAQSRQQLRASDRVPFGLYLDEFHNYLTPSMADMLSGARKYGLGLVLAHQDLSQLGSASGSMLGAAISNPATRICFRLGDRDARSLADGFAHFEGSDLQQLGVGQAICRVEQADQDFNLRTIPIPDLDEPEASRQREAAVASSRSRYARHRADIETEIAAAYQAEPRSVRRPAAQPQPRPDTGASVASESVRKSSSRLRAEAKQVDTQTRPVEPGRGGQQHKYWQSLLRERALDAGWRARVEAPLAEGRGFVDVLMTTEGRSIGVEVSVSTNAEHELANIRKCLAAELDHVCCLVVEPSTLKELRSLTQDKLSRAEKGRVFVGRPDAALSSLDRFLHVGHQSKEEPVRGYVVHVEGAEGSPEQTPETLADLIKRMWRNPKKDGGR